jgi:hypothetical protein
MWASHAQLAFHTCDCSHYLCTMHERHMQTWLTCSVLRVCHWPASKTQNSNTSVLFVHCLHQPLCLFNGHTGHSVFHCSCMFPIQSRMQITILQMKTLCSSITAMKISIFLFASTWMVSSIVFSMRKKGLQSTNQTGCHRIHHCAILFYWYFHFINFIQAFIYVCQKFSELTLLHLGFIESVTTVTL